MKIKVNPSSSGTGVVTLSTTSGSNTDRTLTLPDSTGTVLMSDGDGSALTNLPAGGVDGIVSTANATAITIDSSEQVGIGQTNPSAQLHTDKASSITNGLIPSLRVDSHTTGTAANGVGTSIEFYGSMTGQAGVELGKVGFENSNVSGAYGDFVVYTRPNAAVVERLKITSDGRGLSQFTAKAWVNFNGTGTVSIRDSHNISSVVDNGSGSYTPTFANSLANPPVVTGNADHPGNWYGWLSVRDHATGSCDVHSVKASCNCSSDAGQIDVMVFGD